MEAGPKQVLKLMTRPFWPDVSEKKGRKLAIAYGAYLALWMCLIYILIIYDLCFTDETTTLPMQLETLMYFAPLMLLAPFLAWRIWKHAGHISAIIMLIWVAVRMLWEMIPIFFSADMQQISIEIMVYYFAMLFFSIQGVRGTMAKPE